MIQCSICMYVDVVLVAKMLVGNKRERRLKVATYVEYFRVVQ